MSQEPAFGWDWVTGETLDYKKWMAGEPDNGNNLNPNPPADGLAWNQDKPNCVTRGHMGDEEMDNASGTVSGYIIQYTDSNNVTKYKAVRNNPLTWDQARAAAYDVLNPELPAGATNPHLATLKTQAEVNAAKQQISVEQGVPAREVLWLGGYQSLPSGVVETASNVKDYWHWIAETLPVPTQPASALANVENPAVDPHLDWGTLFPHGNQPDNISSSAINENVGYIAGPFGEWGDSTEDPNQKDIKGYLFERDNDFSKIPLDGLVKTLEWVAHYRALCGAESSRIRFAHDAASTIRVNLESAQSRIADTDVSRETILLARNKVLVESGVKMLQSAHEAMQVTLKLLGI
jgi:flagellin-like hook-associated protein FlgL